MRQHSNVSVDTRLVRKSRGWSVVTRTPDNDATLPFADDADVIAVHPEGMLPDVSIPASTLLALRDCDAETLALLDADTLFRLYAP